jgi:hypothetical protein
MDLKYEHWFGNESNRSETRRSIKLEYVSLKTPIYPTFQKLFGYPYACHGTGTVVVVDCIIVIKCHYYIVVGKS